MRERSHGPSGGPAPHVAEVAVARRVAEEVAADRVALVLITGDEHYPVRGSDAVLVRLAEQERLAGEGPGTDVARTTRATCVGDLHEAVVRWPALAACGPPAQVRTLQLHPLLGRGGDDRPQVLGMLALSRSRVRPFSAAETAVVGHLADLLSHMLQARALDDLAADEAGRLGGRLDEVLDPSAHVLPMAVGHLMVREGLGEDEALLLLERRASACGRSVHDLAREVVRSGPSAVDT
ncbi:GAF and ANTAR domain-containing protein [Pseudokineococcus sp. 5B2Z-1]|uniref:GAF and ANTAR domain-containing protein n=1 Tax=Pseudokineococcus sp. 5B2Z-1 TaxID=3132744 RepID=UPI0030AADF31